MNFLKTSFIIVAITLICGFARQENHKTIAPLPSKVDINNLQNCTIPASFTVDDFRWMGGNLRMVVYNMDLYDPEAVLGMKVGDTLIYQSRPIPVTSIEEVGGGIYVNGGLEEGGQWLSRNKDGFFVARIWNDHAVYSELGKTEEALESGFLLIDCGVNPTDPIDTVKLPKQYVESLSEDRSVFNYLNTTVTLKDGMITEIKRSWMP